MPTDTLHEKQQVHELIDRLAPSQVTAVRGLLEAMLDPVSRALAGASIDMNRSLTPSGQPLAKPTSGSNITSR
jgi:hypothetical protein